MYHFQFRINKTKSVYSNIEILGMKDEKMNKNTAKQQEITLFGLQLFFGGNLRRQRKNFCFSSCLFAY
jgi:hypothetical protein